MGIDGRWSAIRITLESQLIGLALILLAHRPSLGAVRQVERADLRVRGGIAVLLIGLAALWSSMVLQRPQSPVGDADPVAR